MKNLSIVLNVIMLGALSFLYYKVYHDKPAMQVVSGTSKNEARIVFINSDTLLDHYPLLKSLEKTFNNKRDSVEKILMSKDKAIKQAYAQFEQQAASLPEDQQKKIYESLMRQQQELEALRDDMLKHLSTEQDKMQDSIHYNLVDYLKVYNRKHGYDYIMSYQRGNGILFANDSLEITNDVLKGLIAE